MRKYIHYGNDHFEPAYFSPIQNVDNWTKPTGGLWASSVDALFGWKDWCECEDYRECDLNKSFTFTLKENANVIYIHSIDDLKDLPTRNNDNPFTTYLDFEKMVENGIDAIEVFTRDDLLDFMERHVMFGDNVYDTLLYRLHPWDCDSIIIMNPDIIQLE